MVACKKFQIQWLDRETSGILENLSLRRDDRLREVVTTKVSTVYNVCHMVFLFSRNSGKKEHVYMCHLTVHCSYTGSQMTSSYKLLTNSLQSHLQNHSKHLKYVLTGYCATANHVQARSLTTKNKFPLATEQICFVPKGLRINPLHKNSYTKTSR